MAATASEERIRTVLNAIGAGADCVHAVMQKTKFSYTSIFNALRVLRHRRLIESAGTKPNPSPHGGRVVQLFRVAGGATPAVVHEAQQPKNAARVTWREPQHQSRSSGSGKVAGKIEIGRGYKWGGRIGGQLV